MDTTRIRTLYVFVEISIDSEHLAKTIRRNFPSERESFIRDVICATDSSTNGGVDVPIGTVIGGQGRSEGKVRGDRGVVEVEQDIQVAQPSTRSNHTRLALVSTIQFAAALNRLKEDLSASSLEEAPSAQKSGDKTLDDPLAVVPYSSSHAFDAGTYEITVPRSKPLSPGEILGCTAPRLNDVDAILSVVDSAPQASILTFHQDIWQMVGSIWRLS
jgi:2-(3-amino-3-carboxypropyl)histidine synthase